MSDEYEPVSSGELFAMLKGVLNLGTGVVSVKLCLGMNQPVYVEVERVVNRKEGAGLARVLEQYELKEKEE